MGAVEAPAMRASSETAGTKRDSEAAARPDGGGRDTSVTDADADEDERSAAAEALAISDCIRRERTPPALVACPVVASDEWCNAGFTAAKSTEAEPVAALTAPSAAAEAASAVTEVDGQKSEQFVYNYGG